MLGVDISEPLIARARACLPPGAPVAFEIADAGSAAVSERAFDLLFSRFGVMFFDDPAAAFAHMRGALKPGGRLAFVCWRTAAENDWVRLPMGAIRDIVTPPPPPDPEAPGPFSFGDRGRVERILKDAGFVDVALAPFDHLVPLAAAPRARRRSTMRSRWRSRSAPCRARSPISPTRFARRRRTRCGRPSRNGRARSVLIDGAAWIVTARNPAA